MRQSRALSLAEAVANTSVGYGLPLATQAVLFPILGLAISLADQLLIGSVFTVMSVARSYAMRRLFERLR